MPKGKRKTINTTQTGAKKSLMENIRQIQSLAAKLQWDLNALFDAAAPVTLPHDGRQSPPVPPDCSRLPGPEHIPAPTPPGRLDFIGSNDPVPLSTTCKDQGSMGWGDKDFDILKQITESLEGPKEATDE